MIKNKKQIYLLDLVLSAPSIIIGAITMKQNGISSLIYLQNIVFLIFLWILSCFVIYTKVRVGKRTIWGIVALSIAMLVLTFVDPGLEGVHRWLAIGPLRLYVSSIVLPFLLIIIWKLLIEKREKLVLGIVLIVAIILSLQPDAAQLTAFGIPLMLLLHKRIKKSTARVTSLVLGFMIIRSWIFLDDLQPVMYVEDIFDLVMDMGVFWTLLGVVSLALLLLPFMVFPPKGQGLLSSCLLLYFLLVIIAVWFGNFPLPMMGYGISPMIGYFIGVTWLFKQGKSEP